MKTPLRRDAREFEFCYNHDFRNISFIAILCFKFSFLFSRSFCWNALTISVIYFSSFSGKQYLTIIFNTPIRDVRKVAHTDIKPIRLSVVFRSDEKITALNCLHSAETL